jgi:energy-coupling factor transporter ATP-binding protein EcfA2
VRFYSTTHWSDLPNDAVYPCVGLKWDNWNDYGYQTLREFAYHEAPGGPRLEGSVKILHRGQYTTQLPPVFDKLDDSFCSLGQSLEYYRQLGDLGAQRFRPILTALNDVVFNPDIGDRFASDEGFKTSLLRFSDAEKAYNFGGALVGRPVRKQGNAVLSFRFTTTVPGATSPHVLELLSPNATRLNRIAALIGRNGTGKTQVLARFANAMSGLKREGSFEPERPDFNRVIAVSYSVFDEFDRPRADESFSYTYCGVRRTTAVSSRLDPDGLPTEDADASVAVVEQHLRDALLTTDEVRGKLSAALERVASLDREAQWRNAMMALFGEQVDLLTLFDGSRLRTAGYAALSSGQRILALVIAEIIAAIEPQSVILFDEPELYLHPDAITGVTRALHEILQDFDSFAIVATHSPIILQEIPARYVRVFHREGTVPIVDPLDIESFGESLSTITDRVFEVTPSQQNYRAYLRRLTSQHSADTIIAMFGNPGLGMHARAFLRALDESTSETSQDA